MPAVSTTGRGRWRSESRDTSFHELGKYSSARIPPCMSSRRPTCASNKQYVRVLKCIHTYCTGVEIVRAWMVGVRFQALAIFSVRRSVQTGTGAQLAGQWISGVPFPGIKFPIREDNARPSNAKAKHGAYMHPLPLVPSWRGQTLLFLLA